MVDVSSKKVTERRAHARSIVRLPENIVALFKHGEIQSKKGPVFATAIIAGTMAAKKTSDLIPFCHQIPLEHCDIDILLEDNRVCIISLENGQYLRVQVVINAMVNTSNKTGVEMEALMAASVASLTIYDMCKAISHDIVITETRLIRKSGGKSDLNLENEIDLKQDTKLD